MPRAGEDWASRSAGFGEVLSGWTAATLKPGGSPAGSDCASNSRAGVGAGGSEQRPRVQQGAKCPSGEYLKLGCVYLLGYQDLVCGVCEG